MNIFIQTIHSKQHPVELFQHLRNKNNCAAALYETADQKASLPKQSYLFFNSMLELELKDHRLTIRLINPKAAEIFSKLQQSKLEKLSLTKNKFVLQVPQFHSVSSLEENLKKSELFAFLRFFQRTVASFFAKQNIHMPCLFSFDLIEYTQQLQAQLVDPFDVPDLFLFVPSLIIQHENQTFKITSVAKVADLEQIFNSNIPSHVKTSVSNTEAQALTSDGEFIDRVKEAKKYISSGDVYQLVLSRTFQVSCPDPMSAYMRLRVENPSPYMFYFQHPNFTLFGASPERCLEVSATNKDITLSPIAGTRRRGFNTNGQINSDLDNKIQLALTLDEKEIAEHIMLVDLARNDIAAVAQAGSRKVVQLLESEFYSHVIHLVSTVTGKLKPQYDALHAYQACMNMGTLTGSPKFRANQLIRQFENARRGFYGGAVGFLSTQGDLNTTIVIRSALVKNGQAYVQAGAGIVYDSDPQSECNETKHKAAAVLNVLTKEMEPSHA